LSFLKHPNMAPPIPSYTKVTHSATYPAINPSQPALSTTGKVVLITGASGGIGRATAISFAASSPKALILLGRRSDALAETAQIVKSRHDGGVTFSIQTHAADLCDSANVRAVMNKVATEFGGIDILVHCAGALAPVVPLVEADPSTFLDGYKTTVVGTLVVAQSFTMANRQIAAAADGKPVTFINLTTAGILFPPFSGMGAYVSSKMAAVKLLQAFATENPNVRLHTVHPGFLDTDMSTQLAKTTKLPFAFDDGMCTHPARPNLIRHVPKMKDVFNVVDADLPIPLQSLFLQTISSGLRRRRPNFFEASLFLPRGMSMN
jgi:NAD(P)-dependent dehydrogenase (short-subunit alcohol dehydrogenase family)